MIACAKSCDLALLNLANRSILEFFVRNACWHCIGSGSNSIYFPTKQQ